MSKDLLKKKPLKKRIKKKFRKAFKPKNIGKFLIVAATAAVLATSILPYIL